MTHDELNMKKIMVGKNFVLAERADIGSARKLMEKYTFGDQAIAEIVFVNGYFEPELSRLEELPKGIKVMVANWGETEAIGDDSMKEFVEDIGRLCMGINFEDKRDKERDRVIIDVDRGVLCKRPIHLMFLTVVPPPRQSDDQMDVVAASFPKVWMGADENSECSIVETYAGDEGGGEYLTHTTTTISLSESAKVDYYKLQQEGAEASHVAEQNVFTGAKSSFASHSISLGSKLTRNELNVTFCGEGAKATLNGLVIAGDEQRIDNHTLLYHQVENCASQELYKHVLDGKAKVGFEGKICVLKDAQKTDSKLASKSLVLTDEACMEAKPELEIYADDVKCSHGATSGPVDENAVFYLVSRGLSLEQARHLMTYAFAADVTRRIRVAAVRERVERLLAERYGLPEE